MEILNFYLYYTGIRILKKHQE